jgi:hypothetical protein
LYYSPCNEERGDCNGNYVRGQSPPCRGKEEESAILEIQSTEVDNELECEWITVVELEGKTIPAG